MPTNNPYMHTASDTIDTLNMDLVTMTTQVAVATLVDLASE
jgi:hypothetical protein